MSWEHASEARAALNAIVSDPEHGVAALSSAQTMSNLLKDLLPDAPREKSILVAAAEAGLANTLRQHVDQGMDPDTAIRLTSSSFSSTTPFTPDACGWVTGEIATALGMSHSQPAGQGGASGANPPGFDPTGQQGMPTQVAGSPGGYTPGQQPTQGFGQGPGQQGGGFGSAAAQETRPGQWQSPGQQPGGFAGQPGAGGQPGGFGQNQPGGFGQPGGPGGYGVQPGAPGAGYAQPGAPGGWQGPGQPGAQPGYGQPGGPGGPGGWQPGGGGFGPVPGGPKGGGSRRGLLIGGGLALLVVVAVVIGVSLSGGNPKPTPTPHNSSPLVNPTTPTPTPNPTTPATNHPPGTDSLATIMNPPTGSPVGTSCGTAKTFSLDKSTLVAKTFCSHTTRTNVVVWGYQFDNSADYAKGVASINHFVGFDKVTPGTTCPPPSGTAEGKVGWHAKHNPKYFSKTGQDLECLIDGNKPVLIWTMPTQDVFFIGQNNTTGTSVSSLIKWWETLTYGP